MSALAQRPDPRAFESVRPGVRFGLRPERAPEPPLPRLENRLQGRLACRAPAPAELDAMLRRVRGAAERIRRGDELERRRRRRALAALAGGEPTARTAMVEVFAQVLVECEALFGLTLHDGQLRAAWAMLRGALVEMRTGEGKTLAVALTAIAAALGGTPVHVITANDYLAERDAETLRRLYERFSLSASSVTERATPEERARAYRCDIVHVTARQLLFDYLRDARAGAVRAGELGERLASLTAARRPPPLLRGLCFAVIDEADDILVDEARTPFVLSEPVEDEADSRARAAVALALARALHADVDFELDPQARTVRLGASGAETVRVQTRRLGGDWRLARYREELVRQALAALHLYRRDRDYLVRDGHVVLIDESSGRAQPERRLRHGLHQMLELKERCAPRPETETVAELSFQRFFARYHRLCGTSGTLHELRAELRELYRLPLVRVPTHRPCRLRRLPDTVVADRAAQLEALTRRVLACREAGRPLLVGTRTLALSERVAEHLAGAGIGCRLLNARQDAAEAALIATAGASGTVTIATNLAGRGADIPLDARAREAGGLHVICLELNDSGRVDRQLFGRAARQGDPGSGERLLCLDDETLAAALPDWLLAAVRRQDADDAARAARLGAALFALARRRIERRQARERLNLFYRTETTLRELAVAGEQEYP